MPQALTSYHSSVVKVCLLDNGFRFRYNFLESLRHWERIAPYDFDPQRVKEVQLIRPQEVPQVVVPQQSSETTKLETVG